MASSLSEPVPEDAGPMVAEYRQIVFSNEEIVAAIVAFDGKHKTDLPPGNIVKCLLSKRRPVVARATFQDIYAGTERTVHLDASFLAAALLDSCIARKIPVPRQADKALQPIGDSLSLNFSILPQPEPEPIFVSAAELDANA